MGYQPTSGTIIIVVVRDDDKCAIVAAEQLSSGFIGTDHYKTTIHKKIQTHKTLPLAIAHGGIGELPKAEEGQEEVGNVPISHFVNRIIESIRTSEELEFSNIERLVSEEILPFVVEARRLCNGFENYQGPWHLELIFILSFKGHPKVHRLLIEDRICRDRKEEFFSCPQNLRDHFNVLHDSRTLYGSHFDSVAEVAIHFRSTIMNAIDYEKSMCNSNKIQCGGDVDVVIVDQFEAKWT